MDKKTFIEGIAVGAVAGAIATLLLAPKSGKETRDEIKAHLTEIKNKIVERLAAVDEFTQAKYQEVVKAVIAEFEVAKKITVDEAKEIESRLAGGYEAIKQTVRERCSRGDSQVTCEHAEQVD